MNVSEFFSGPRGSVRNRQCAEQGRDYTGMVFGTISPTDIDGSMDFCRGQIFVFMEFKREGQELSNGQRWHLEALVDVTSCAKRSSIALVGRHDTPSEDPIDAANTTVSEYYHAGRWRRPNSDITMRRAVEKFLAGINSNE